jgi:hypothetical protein
MKSQKIVITNPVVRCCICGKQVKFEDIVYRGQYLENMDITVQLACCAECGTKK